MDPYIPDQPSALASPFIERENIVYSAIFPIAFNNKPLGVVFFNYRSEHLLSDDERKTITKTLKDAASAIWIHRDAITVQRSAHERIARAVCRLIIQTLNKPIAIWRYVSGSKLSLWGNAGVPAASLVKRIQIDTARESWFARIAALRALSDASMTKDLAPLVNRYISFMRFSDKASIYPLRYDHLLVGVMVIFRERSNSNHVDLSALSHLVDVVAGELLRHSLIARWLTHSATQLSARLESSAVNVMTTAVGMAVTFTGADSGALLLYDRTTERFSLGSMVPRQRNVRFQSSVWIDGLMRNIITNNEPHYFKADQSDPFVQKGLLELGRARSLIVVPLDISKGQAGLFYVRGKRPSQFLDEHVTWMKHWAQRTAANLGRSRSLVSSISNVENAVRSIEDVATWQRICSVIKERFDFEFVSLHIVRRIEGIIETVCETGGAEGRVARSKHSLCADDDLRDIQVHIALSDPKRVEITSGWHDKFDERRYAQHGHATYKRVWIPLVVLRDSKGRLVELEWLDRWVPSKRNEKTYNEKGGGQCLIMEMESPIKRIDAFYIDTLGVLDAGFRTGENTINETTGLELLRFANRYSLEIYSTCLASLLEQIALEAWKSVEASSAVLIFPWTGETLEPTAIVTSGNIDRSFVLSHPPRPDGLGARVLEHHEAAFIPNLAEGQKEDELAREHPEIYKQGVRSVLALPLYPGSLKGVLYVHHRERSYFQEDEISSLTHYGRCAEHAIAHATRKISEHEKNKVAEVLSAFTTALAHDPESDSLLSSIASNIADMLAADVVVLREFDAQNTGAPSDAVAGRLQDNQQAASAAFEDYDERNMRSLLPCYLPAAKLPRHLQENEKLSCAMRLALHVEMKVLVQSL